MTDEPIIRGIIELYESCEPDSSGRVTQTAFQRGTRLPKDVLVSISKLFDVNKQEMLSFIDFWAMVERSIAVDSPGGEGDDDLVCLRFLRDKVLSALDRKGSVRSVSHGALMAMLVDVRNRAVNKSTWDEALRSSREMATDPEKLHSVDVISGAIKVMLDEYLGDGQVVVSDESPSIIDELRVKLTESECTSSQLRENLSNLSRDNEKYLAEISLLKATNSKYVSEIAELKATINESAKELSQLRSSTFSKNNDSLEALQTLLATRDEQIVNLEKLCSSRKGQPELIDSLKSQIQTLEVQKSDAELEVTRLQKALIAKDFVGSATPARSGRTSATVSVYGQEAAKPPKPKPTTRKGKSRENSNECIQQ